jgi:hypothetical protein
MSFVTPSSLIMPKKTPYVNKKNKKGKGGAVRARTAPQIPTA